METVQLVRAAVCPSDWTFSIDIKDTYLHVPIHPDSYSYLRLALTSTEVFTSELSLRVKYNATDIYSHSGGHHPFYETEVLSSRACVS